MKNLNIEAKVDNLPQVLMFIDSYLEEADCPMKAQMQIDISVEEIFVNIAQYAYPGRIGHADIQISGSRKARANTAMIRVLTSVMANSRFFMVSAPFLNSGPIFSGRRS